MKQQRSGMLDLMRFILTLCVVLVHVIDPMLDQQMTVLRGGTIAVEFFFLLSGFLLASSADRAERMLPAGEVTWKVMKRKVCSIYPVWMAALILQVIHMTVREGIPLRTLLRAAETSTSTFLMASELGLPDSLRVGLPWFGAASVSYSWYIPVMLLGTLILCPLLYRHSKTFAYIAAPLIALFGCAHLFHDHGKLFVLQAEWLGFTYGATVRGLSEMCLGVFAYEMSQRFTRRLHGRLTATGRILFTLAEAACLCYGMGYVLTRIRAGVMLGVLLAFAAFIAMAYTGLSYSAQLVRGPVFNWLGRFSLSVYLGQGSAVLVAQTLAPRLTPPMLLAVTLAAALVSGLCVHALAWALRRLFHIVHDGLSRLIIQPAGQKGAPLT